MQLRETVQLESVDIVPYFDKRLCGGGMEYGMGLPGGYGVSNEIWRGTHGLDSQAHYSRGGVPEVRFTHNSNSFL